MLAQMGSKLPQIGMKCTTCSKKKNKKKNTCRPERQGVGDDDVCVCLDLTPAIVHVTGQSAKHSLKGKSTLNRDISRNEL